MTKKQYCDTPVIAASIIVGIFCLLVGIVIGMIIQQTIIYHAIETVAPAFSGVSVTIDINETALVDGVKQIAEQQVKEYKSGAVYNCTGIMCR